MNPRPPTRYSFTWTTRTAPEDCRARAMAKLIAASLEGEAVMLAKGSDGVGVIGVRVGIRHADDNRPEAAVVASAGRQHGGRQRVSFVVASGGITIDWTGVSATGSGVG